MPKLLSRSHGRHYGNRMISQPNAVVKGFVSLETGAKEPLKLPLIDVDPTLGVKLAAALGEPEDSTDGHEPKGDSLRSRLAEVARSLSAAIFRSGGPEEPLHFDNFSGYGAVFEETSNIALARYERIARKEQEAALNGITLVHLLTHPDPETPYPYPSREKTHIMFPVRIESALPTQQMQRLQA